MRREILVLLTVLACTLFSVQLAAANLVTNGGFETGNYNGWTITPAASGTELQIFNSSHSGTYAAAFGSVGNYDDAISQVIATTPGSVYTFDFWLQHNFDDRQNDFHAYWNGNSILDFVNSSSFNFTHYSFTEIASGTSTTIGFSGREVPAWYQLDDVSVTSSVPEPATFVLFGAGLAGVAALRKRIIG